VKRSLNIVQVDIDERFSSLELVCFDLLCSDSRLRFFLFADRLIVAALISSI